ncbi:MAG: phage tail protein [Firmicutes bacterium]|nr:phage tail protein [Bacillota bacterium]
MTFADYFFYLLHRVFKRAPRQDGDADKLTKALGPNYDAAMEAIFQLREQSFGVTATGEALDQIGKDRLLPRFREETDEEYRLRIMAADEIHSQSGTAESMLEAFRKLGFADSEIKELREEDPTRWAEFSVNLVLPEAGFTEAQRSNIISNIKKMKPGHTKLAALNIEVPAADLAGDESISWAETVTWNQFACPLPAENLYPSEEIYPC